MSENSLPKCNVCDKKFTSRNKLFKHLEVSCTEELMVKEAQQNEKYLNYDKAIYLYDKIGKPEEAARVRKLKAEQGAVKVDQTLPRENAGISSSFVWYISALSYGSYICSML